MRSRIAISIILLATLAEAASVKAQTNPAADLKSGALLQYGVTVGLALAIHMPAGNANRKLEQVATSAMPYLLVSPTFWRQMGDVTRKYCASDWILGSKKDAADAYARELARAQLVRAFDAELTNKPVPTEARAQRARTIARTHAIARLRRNPAITTMPTGAEYYPTNESVPDWQVTNITGWNVKPGWVGKCKGAPFVNVWVGVPTKFSAGASVRNVQAGYDVQPRVAAGWALVVSPYLHILAGASYSEFKTSNTESYGGMWSPVVGLGGNIDLIGLIVK